DRLRPDRRDRGRCRRRSARGGGSGRGHRSEGRARMKERGTRRPPRATVDDPYAKPWVARDAAKYLVRDAVARGHDPAEMIDLEYGLFRPGYTAVVGKRVGAEPKRAIAPDAIGVTGFAPEGEVFPLAEVWRDVTGEEMPPSQPSLVQDAPPRRRRRGAA